MKQPDSCVELEGFKVKCSPPYEVNPDHLESATVALQAQERLYLAVRESGKYNRRVYEDIRECLDRLRCVKGELEGTHFDYEPLKMNTNEQLMQDLRQLVLMHVPSSVTDNIKEKFRDLVFKLFQDTGQQIISAVLQTCPWYWSTQRERGEQARHNVIFIVYRNDDDRFLSPASHHVKDQCEVTDLGFIYAVELYHFVHFLVKGKSRFLDAVFCPQPALLYCNPRWMKLRESLDYKLLMSLRGFVEQCRGQAVGNVAKKRKSGQMGLREGVTFHQLCESFRLLHHAHNAAHGRPPHTAHMSFDDHNGILPDIAVQAGAKLKLLYQDPDVSKQDILNLLMSWRREIDGLFKNFKFSEHNTIEEFLGEWMSGVRSAGQIVRPFAGSENLQNVTFKINSTDVSREDNDKLETLLSKIGGPMTNIQPSQIIMATRAGSYLYGVSTPESDIDYIVVYAEHTNKILSSCNRLSEIVENRGPDKMFEYGAYEVRTFSEMLLKCSVVILELVFARELEYVSPAWKALQENRLLFVCEKAIQQYIGLIKNNFNMIKSKKKKTASADRKLFYQIFHKLHSLEYFLQGESPPVTCTGETQEFIMKVRQAPLEGDYTRENLYKLAKEKYDNFKKQHANKSQRLPENPDYRFLTNWLSAIRGLVDDKR